MTASLKAPMAYSLGRSMFRKGCMRTGKGVMRAILSLLGISSTNLGLMVFFKR